MLKKTSKGFTLIEILVVMVIIGLLAIISLGSFRSTQMKSRDARRKHDLGQVQRGLEAYFNDKGAYPASVPFGAAWEVDGVLYMSTVPDDPFADGGRTYDYVIDPTGAKWYRLFAVLENEDDPAFKTGGYTGTNCGGGILCNYGVSSTNIGLE